MDANFTIRRGDLLRDVVIIVRDNIGPVDLDGVTATFRMVNMLTGAVVIEGESATPAASIPFTASGATLTAPAHNLNNGEEVTGKSSGVLPGNLSTQTRYFVVNAAPNTLQLALVKDGTPITTSGAGSGSHSLLSGRLSYTWQTGDTDTAGTYHAEFITLKDAKPFTYPNAEPFLVEIVSPAEWGERGVAIALVRDRVQPEVSPTLTQGEIERQVDLARLATIYAPGTFYKVRDCVLPPVRNGFSYQCVQPGTSGSLSFSEFSTDVFETFSDGQTDPQLIWQNVGTDQFNPGIAGAESNIYDIGKASRALWSIRARRCADFVDEGDISYSQMYEHATDMAHSFEPFRRPTRIVRLDG